MGQKLDLGYIFVLRGCLNVSCYVDYKRKIVILWEQDR